MTNVSAKCTNERHPSKKFIKEWATVVRADIREAVRSLEDDELVAAENAAKMAVKSAEALYASIIERRSQAGV